MKRIPIALIYLRLVIGLILLLLSIFNVKSFAIIAISLCSIGLLSDIFDGIIARRLNVSTERLRRLDSTIDQIFWCLVVISAFIQYPDFFYNNSIKLILLVSAEVITYIISFARFRKEVATHAISSKIWTLLLFACLIEIIYHGNSNFLFLACFYFGLLTRLEIIAILLTLKQWTNDVPSIYHAVKLRQGKAIKRNKLFNG
jgi:phosphatidylglycerophosphate synthase